MEIEIIDNKKILISFEDANDTFGIQRLIDYAKYLQATAGSQAKQEDIDALANEINAGWWNNNKHRFIYKRLARSLSLKGYNNVLLTNDLFNIRKQKEIIKHENN